MPDLVDGFVGLAGFVRERRSFLFNGVWVCFVKKLMIAQRSGAELTAAKLRQAGVRAHRRDART